MAFKLQGAGLGLRREMLEDVLPWLPGSVDFWEVAPENWIPLGGTFREDFNHCVNQAVFTTHGVSLSIGGPDHLDHRFLHELKQFLDRYNIALYSEHLSYCCADGHLYDLMPVPFTEEAVSYIAERVKIVQDILERPLVLENVSYYIAPHQQLSELEFINAVLSEANCKMLLDVNNVYVNSINHRYDPYTFIDGLPSERIVYGHIAGHYEEAEDLRVDTHGSDVIEPVWDLLAHSYRKHHVFPTLLERDFNIPALDVLLDEVQRIKQIQQSVHDNKQQGVA